MGRMPMLLFFLRIACLRKGRRNGVSFLCHLFLYGVRRGEGKAGEWGQENPIPLSPFLCPDSSMCLATFRAPILRLKPQLLFCELRVLGKGGGMGFHSFAPEPFVEVEGAENGSVKI
jgi:hypothetical protein